MGSASYAWTSTVGFGWAASKSLRGFASKELQEMYIPQYASGKWLGSMCLTEAHCGTDLGLMRTRAVPREDGSYAISGTKMFITAGEHDLSENIVYLMFAYLWARAGISAQAGLDSAASDDAFYQSKTRTANFYFDRLLPRIETLEKSVLAGAASLMAMPEAQFLAHI